MLFSFFTTCLTFADNNPFYTKENRSDVEFAIHDIVTQAENFCHITIHGDGGLTHATFNCDSFGTAASERTISWAGVSATTFSNLIKIQVTENTRKTKQTIEVTKIDEDNYSLKIVQ